jgi:hypothetical protein
MYRVFNVFSSYNRVTRNRPITYDRSLCTGALIQHYYNTIL